MQMLVKEAISFERKRDPKKALIGMTPEEFVEELRKWDVNAVLAAENFITLPNLKDHGIFAPFYVYYNDGIWKTGKNLMVDALDQIKTPNPYDIIKLYLKAYFEELTHVSIKDQIHALKDRIDELERLEKFLK